MDNTAKKVRTPEVVTPEPGILSVEETEKLFRTNENIDPEVCGLLALGAFAGLRSSAVERLQYENIDFKNRGILIESSIAKTGRRHYIEGLPDNLWAWLERTPGSGGSNDDSALKELIGNDERVYDNALHRTALLLWEHRVQIEQQDCLVKAIRFKKTPTGQLKSERFGDYVIRTDRVDLDESTLSTIHRSLTTIESSFRAMKSELGLRPNLSQKRRGQHGAYLPERIGLPYGVPDNK